jgi:hypothetical protein
MKTLSLRHLIVLGSAALLLAGCSPSKASLGEIEVDVPTWFANPPKSPDYLFGLANEQSQTMQTAIEKAKHSATVDLAGKMEAHVQGMTKRFQEDIGTGLDATEQGLFESVSKIIVNETVYGVQIKEQKIMQNEETKLYSVYALVEMPIGTANKALVSKLKEQQALALKLDASKSFKELEAEIAKNP